MTLAIFFQGPFCSIEEMFKRYSTELKTIYWGDGTHRNGACLPNARQSTRAGTCEAHASRCRACAHQWRTQAGAMHARIQTVGSGWPAGLKCRARTSQGTCKKARHGCVLTDGMQWKHPGKGTWQGVPPFSAPLAADRVCSCHHRPTTPVESGWGWPARPHPNEQLSILWQCHVVQGYCSAHTLAGRARALGQSWRRPFDS